VQWKDKTYIDPRSLPVLPFCRTTHAESYAPGMVCGIPVGGGVPRVERKGTYTIPSILWLLSQDLARLI